MKPVSYQSLPSSVNGGHPNLPLNHLLGPSKVMYCDKCGFASTDAAAFNKHVMEHMGTRFYCFYCNNIFFSEAELNVHLKQHTSKYPFTCPHCGQGYMRRLCLVKHIDRLHSKSISQGPAKPGIAKGLQVPVCSALTSASTADPAPLRPLVRVSVPAPSIPAVRLGRDDHRGKTLDTNSTNVTVEHFPFNGLIQHNRALTVSLPEEVSIPAGCLVELVEVKTVNGTKELKLRLVSQQENESVIKDARTTLSQNTTLGKPLLTTFNHSNLATSASMGTCIVNRKQTEPKTVTVERPAVVPASVSNNIPNPVSKEKYVLKRPSTDVIDLESSPVILNQVPKKILCPVREGNSGSRIPPALVSHKAAPPTVTPSRIINRLNSVLHPESMGTGVPQRALEEIKLAFPEQFSSIAHRRPTDTKSARDASVVVKVEPGGSHLKSNAVTKTLTEAAPLAPQIVKSTSPSLNRPSVSAAQIRPPALLVNKANGPNESLVSRSPNKPISIRTPVLSNHATSSKMLPRPQEVRFSGVARRGADASEPESFPVISSVFSLSQQPEDVQGPIKPLVMALRGIVMDKDNRSGSATPPDGANGTEQEKKAEVSEGFAQVAPKKESPAHNPPSATQTSETVKVEEQDKGIQHPPSPAQNRACVKEEKSSSLAEDAKSNPATDSKAPPVEEPRAKIPTSAEASTMPDPPQPLAKTKQEISSRFLTVSLKRVQVGVWKKCKKGLKPKISRDKSEAPASGECAVLHPMPLRADQPVTRPGPYQPVVVLNHPRPRVCAQGFRTDSFADSAASEAAPECQILKMRLSKVMGQKYEVMGYTVRVFP